MEYKLRIAIPLNTAVYFQHFQVSRIFKIERHGPSIYKLPSWYLIALMLGSNGSTPLPQKSLPEPNANHNPIVYTGYPVVEQ